MITIPSCQCLKYKPAFEGRLDGKMNVNSWFLDQSFEAIGNKEVIDIISTIPGEKSNKLITTITTLVRDKVQKYDEQRYICR